MSNINKKILSNAPDEKAFRTEFGEIKSLPELRSVLIARGKPFYDKHVSESKNNFADWIENVFGDAELAQSLRQANSFRECVVRLDKKIKYLELWMEHNKDKEILFDYLANGPFSISRKMGAPVYEPQHHVFETGFDLSEISDFIYIHKKAQEMFDKSLNHEIIPQEILTKKQGFFSRLFKKKF